MTSLKDGLRAKLHDRRLSGSTSTQVVFTLEKTLGAAEQQIDNEALTRNVLHVAALL